MDTLIPLVDRPDPIPESTLYVLGFHFSPEMDRVALIRKARPDWQAGKLNGIGGRIHRDETPREAMVREFAEETGVKTSPADWDYTCGFAASEAGRKWTIFAFCSQGDPDRLRSTTDEQIEILPTAGIRDRLDLVTLCLDFLRSSFKTLQKTA